MKRAAAVWAALMVVVSNMTVAAVCITVSVHGQREAARSEAAARAAQQREADQRWCPIVLALVPRPGDPRPAPGRGQIIADTFTHLAEDFDCGHTSPDRRPAIAPSPRAEDHR